MVHDLRRYITIITEDTKPHLVNVRHITSRRNLRSILQHGLDPKKTVEGKSAVYVWSDWGSVQDSLRRSDDGESSLDVILELTAPESWLTKSDDEIEAYEWFTIITFHRKCSKFSFPASDDGWGIPDPQLSRTAR